MARSPQHKATVHRDQAETAAKRADAAADLTVTAENHKAGEMAERQTQRAAIQAIIAATKAEAAAPGTRAAKDAVDWAKRAAMSVDQAVDTGITAREAEGPTTGSAASARRCANQIKETADEIDRLAKQTGSETIAEIARKATTLAQWAERHAAEFEATESETAE